MYMCVCVGVCVFVFLIMIMYVCMYVCICVFDYDYMLYFIGTLYEEFQCTKKLKKFKKNNSVKSKSPLRKSGCADENLLYAQLYNVHIVVLYIV